MSKDVLIVGIVLFLASLAPLPVLWLAQALGLDPATLQGAGFQVEPLHLALLFGFVAVTCGVPVAAFRWVHHRALGELGLRGGLWRNLLAGHLIGGTLAGSALGIELWGTAEPVLSWAVPDTVGPGELVASYLFFLLALLTLNSLKEELLFRVYPLEVLGRAGSAWPILLVSAALFAATHLVLEPPSLHGFGFRFLFGVLAGRLYLASGSLWAVIGAHNGWNWVFGSISGNWRLGGLWMLSSGGEPPWLPLVLPGVLLVGVAALEGSARAGLLERLFPRCP
jgi:membrane protease YdiL (CAAX protease family)